MKTVQDLKMELNEVLKYTQAEMKMKLNNQVTKVKLKGNSYKEMNKVEDRISRVKDREFSIITKK